MKQIITLFLVCLAAIDVMAQTREPDSISTQTLDEVTVTASTTRHKLNGDEYLVTGNMRERSGNISELLNLLLGVKVNRMNK